MNKRQRKKASRRAYVNGYDVEKVYGGPEEGGWHYDVHYPQVTIRCRSRHHAVIEARKFRMDAGSDNPDSDERDANIRIMVQSHPGRLFPRKRPTYS